MSQPQTYRKYRKSLGKYQEQCNSIVAQTAASDGNKDYDQETAYTLVCYRCGSRLQDQYDYCGECKQTLFQDLHGEVYRKCDTCLVCTVGWCLYCSICGGALDALNPRYPCPCGTEVLKDQGFCFHCGLVNQPELYIQHYPECVSYHYELYGVCRYCYFCGKNLQMEIDSDSSAECPICLEDILPSHTAGGCVSHPSHRACLDKWLAIKDSCPVCRI